MMNKWDWYWRVSLKWRQGKCWFVGHDVAYVNWRIDNDPDYCTKCFIDWPQEVMDLPKYLTRIYVWVVERDWRWFNALDDWLRINHRNWLPRWWEY